MKAKAYLQRVKKLDAMIVDKTEEYKRWVTLAEGMGGFCVSERVQSSKNLSQMPDAVAHYVDIEMEIKALKREKNGILHNLERLPTVEYLVLYKSYIKDYTVKDLANYFDKSYAWAKGKRKSALAMLQKILDA